MTEEHKMRLALTVSDPPPLTDEDIVRIEAESKRLYEAFQKATHGMEILTMDDLKVRIGGR